MTDKPEWRCCTCKYYKAPNRHDCSRWRYGYDRHPLKSEDDIIVEDDEGWGADMGPQFGCVLWEKEETPRQSHD